MKLIESGEPIDYIEEKRWSFQFFGNTPPKVENDVTYLAEITPILSDRKTEVAFKIKIIGKKYDLMCSECGSNFISHKGMCSNCYVRQL